MEINFKGTVDISEKDIEEMARLAVYEHCTIGDAIEKVLAHYGDEIYYAREYFWDELVEQLMIKVKEVKPKMKTVRYTGFITLPIKDDDEFYDLLTQGNIDLNESEDVLFEDFTDEY
jgi:hypothetical protein